MAASSLGVAFAADEKEVKIGTDAAGMTKWNDYIKSSLGIDNLTLFPISGKE